MAISPLSSYNAWSSLYNNSYGSGSDKRLSSMFGSIYDNSAWAGTTGRSLSELSSMFTDRYLIQTGAYERLVSSYYDKLSESVSGNAANMSSLKDDAGALRSAAAAAGNSSLYEATEISSVDPETGEKTVSTGYNREAILAAAQGFVDSYNSTIDSLVKVDNVSALQKGVFMTGTTSSYSGLLSKAGISVGSDNKLTIDEDKFNSANISTLKSIFSGRNSYASKVSEKAAQIGRSAVSMNSGLYNASGVYVDLLNSGIFSAIA